MSELRANVERIQEMLDGIWSSISYAQEENEGEAIRFGEVGIEHCNRGMQ